MSLTGFADINFIENGTDRWVIEPQFNYLLDEHFALVVELRYNGFEEAAPGLHGFGEDGPYGGMPAYDEELFGPVAAIIPVRDEEAAIAAANDTVFGLGAAVFTRDVARGEEIAARRLDAGSCFVNAFVKSDPRLPFGGIKESGYGRELSQYGIREFVNIKTVFVA